MSELGIITVVNPVLPNIDNPNIVNPGVKVTDDKNEQALKTLGSKKI